jgi:hypothetical protein
MARVFCAVAVFCYSRTALAAGFFGLLLVPGITLERTGGKRLAARVIGPTKGTVKPHHLKHQAAFLPLRSLSRL